MMVVEGSAPSKMHPVDVPPHMLLSVGKFFAGTQNVSSLQKDEAWRFNVWIQGCDLDNGYLCGTMEAPNVPLADDPTSVVTSWEESSGRRRWQVIGPEQLFLCVYKMERAAFYKCWNKLWVGNSLFLLCMLFL